MSEKPANALAKQPRPNKHSARALQQRATTGDVKQAARTGHAVVREARCPPKETCGSRETLTSRTCPKYTRVSGRVHVPSTLSPTLDWLEGRSHAGRSCHFSFFMRPPFCLCLITCHAHLLALAVCQQLQVDMHLRVFYLLEAHTARKEGSSIAKGGSAETNSGTHPCRVHSARLVAPHRRLLRGKWSVGKLGFRRFSVHFYVLICLSYEGLGWGTRETNGCIAPCRSSSCTMWAWPLADASWIASSSWA